MKKGLPIALSNRHVHLSQEHIEKLFGKRYQLTAAKGLSQPDQYACMEKVDIVGPKGRLKGVRVLGPARNITQVEILLADCFVLGVSAPIRDSGDVKDTPGVTIVGPAGEIELEEGVIVAARHIHMHPEDAAAFGVVDKERVSIKVDGERGLVFDKVLVRVREDYALEMHVDIEEGNAAGVKNGTIVELLK